MDLGRILDRTPELPVLGPLNYFTNGNSAPLENMDGDYCLPVPMTEFQRQLNDEVVSLHYSDVLKFYENGGSTNGNKVLASSLNAMYTNSQLVGTHPYLLVDHYLPPNLLLKDIPNRLSRASGKFTTLVNIIELVRDKKLEIALISRPGKSFDLIEALLLGKMINYKRYSGSYLKASHKSNKKYSTIHLIPSSQLDSTYLGSERFDFIIVLDQTFNPSDPHIVAIRSQGRKTPKDVSGKAPRLAPIIRLVPYYSAEHIAFKLQKYIHDEPTYMRRVVSAIVVLRRRVGAIPIDLKPYYAQGLNFLIPWIADMRSAWPLPLIPDIEEYSASIVENSLLTENPDAKISEEDSSSVKKGSSKEVTTAVESQSNGAETGGPPLEDHDEHYRSKRIKRETFSPGPTEASPSFLSPPSVSSQRENDRQVLTHGILKRLEFALQDLELKDAEIQSLRSLASTQETAHEDTIDEMGKFVNQITQLKEKIGIFERRAERSDNEMSKMKEKIQKQTEEMKLVQLILLAKQKQDGGSSNESSEENTDNTSKTINFATIETQRVRIADLEEELRKANESIGSRSTENEYMRSEYQKASSMATESAEEVQTLKKENEILSVKLATDIANMKQMSFAAERKVQEARIVELQLKLANVEEHLKRVSENEKQYHTRSRYGMRSSSVVPRRPHSPSINNSRKSSPSEREGNGGSSGTNNGPHPLQTMTNSS